MGYMCTRKIFVVYVNVTGHPIPYLATLAGSHTYGGVWLNWVLVSKILQKLYKAKGVIKVP